MKTISIGRKRDEKRGAKEEALAALSKEDRASYTYYVD
jgi:hypothetical protein